MKEFKYEVGDLVSHRVNRMDFLIIGRYFYEEIGSIGVWMEVYRVRTASMECRDFAIGELQDVENRR